MVYCGLMASLTSLSIGYVIGSPNVPETAIRGKDGHCDPNAPYSGFPGCFEFADLLWVSLLITFWYFVQRLGEKRKRVCIVIFFRVSTKRHE